MTGRALTEGCSRLLETSSRTRSRRRRGSRSPIGSCINMASMSLPIWLLRPWASGGLRLIGTAVSSVWASS
jgi:hypothetical protein